jgi:hypothetical protein
MSVRIEKSGSVWTIVKSPAPASSATAPAVTVASHNRSCPATLRHVSSAASASASRS